MIGIGEDITYACSISINNELEQLKERKKWKWPSAVLLFWLITLMMCGILFLVNTLQLKYVISLNEISHLKEAPAHQLNDSLNGYSINTPGCRIPDMEVFDSSIKKFIFKPYRFCDGQLPPLFDSNFSSIFMVTENLPYYNVVSATELKCCYEEFWPNYDNYYNHVEYSDCNVLDSTDSVIDGEYIKVTCIAQENKTVYKDYFPLVPVKQKREGAPLSSSKKPNILILGLDAVSRLNFHRQLPDTHKFLMDELEAFELLGYNKVADNTFPNLIPVLTGMSEAELIKTCWPTTVSHFDNCSFIWKNFSDNNYMTAFGEDCGRLGLFNFGKGGFVNQATDYYFTPFNQEAEAKIGFDKNYNCVQCLGGRETYKVTLDYAKQFVTRMQLESIPYFGFFWSTSLSHDYLNRPSIGDHRFREFMRNLKQNGHLENTIFIFMSDHGIRWGEIRETYQGYMEERLPFVFMVLPRWIKESYPLAVTNLRKNTRKLTTPFDLHETIKDLLYSSNLGKEINIINEPMPRGFFTDIPIDRTCEDAAIDSHWCTCQESNQVMANDTQVINAAQFAVYNINTQLEGYSQCAILVLDSVLNARLRYYSSSTNSHSIKEYTIILKTMPGEGVFEMTVRHKENEHEILTSHDNKRSVDDEWINYSITGTVSRLNLYGDQSYCITDFHLKLYCYCRSLLQAEQKGLCVINHGKVRLRGIIVYGISSINIVLSICS